MAYGNHQDKNRVKSVAALTLTPQSSCPIIAGEEGLWLDSGDGFVKKRNAAGTDVTIAEVSSAGVIFVDGVMTSALATCTYDNGTLGVGATLTGDANGALASIDGVTITAGKIFLFTAEVAGENNGPYSVTQVGTGSLPFILTRLPGFDESAEMKDGTLFVSRGGTVNADTTWKYTAADSPTVGTTSLTFARDPGVVTTNSTQTISAVKTFSSDPVFSLEANHNLAVVASTTADTAGGNMAITGGAGLGTGAGGIGKVVGGVGGATGAGGAAQVTGGIGGATSGAGGAATVAGGAGTNGNAEGGVASLTGGAGQGAGAGAISKVVGGIGGATGAGGKGQLIGGAGGATSGTGGAVEVLGGAGTNGDANGGAVTIRGGAKNGSGADGALSIGDANTASIAIGASGIISTQNGKWAMGATAALIADPGDAGAISVATNGVCALTSGGSGETRTAGIPTFVGQEVTVCMDVDGGGDIAITFASDIGGAGEDVATFADAGDTLVLRGIRVGGVLRWIIVVNIGAVALS